MAKPLKTKKSPPKPVLPQKTYSPEAQEMRALLRRVPDGLKATLAALAGKGDEERERVLAELARGMGKEVLPLFKAAATGKDDSLACAAIRLMPVFGTRAAADILVGIYTAHPGTERASLAAQGARALQARGISVAIPVEERAPETGRFTLRETCVSVPDGVGSRSIAARLQDQYGVWHAIFVLWNDQVGIRDAFMRQMSRAEWAERLERADQRGFAWVPCPADYARWQVEQGRKLTDGAPADDLKQWDEHVGPCPDGYEAPLCRPRTDEERAALVARGEELFQVPDVQRWFLEAADCEPFARRYSDLKVRARLRKEQGELSREFDQLLDEATAALITEELKPLYRDRLADLSRALAWRGADADAQVAAASALEIGSAAPAESNPFLRRLVERSLQAAEALILRGEDLEKLRYRPGKRFARRA